MRLTESSHKQPKLLMFSMTVSYHRFSRKKEYLWYIWRTKTQRRSTKRWKSDRKVSIYHRPRRSFRKILRIEKCLRASPRRRTEWRLTPHFQSPIQKFKWWVSSASFNSTCELHINLAVQRMHKRSVLRQKNTHKGRQKRWVRERKQSIDN